MKTLLAHVPLKKLSLAFALCCVLLLPASRADDRPLQSFPCPTCVSWGQPWKICDTCKGWGWRQVECQTCDGTGMMPWTDLMLCSMCNGHWQDDFGNILCNCCYEGYIVIADKPCDNCDASGWCEEKCPDCDDGIIECPTCSGTGIVWE